MSFKKRIISVSDESLKGAELLAESKINLLKQAIKEAEKHIEINCFKEFSEGFITHTTKKILDKNKGLKELNLTSDKVLNLLDINLSNLFEIQSKFEDNEAKVLFDKEGAPYTKVDKNQFITFTKNDAENERLDVFQSFISSLEEMSKHTHIYKGNVAQMTSNALRFDLRFNKWIINPVNFR